MRVTLCVILELFRFYLVFPDPWVPKNPMMEFLKTRVFVPDNPKAGS